MNGWQMDLWIITRDAPSKSFQYEFHISVIIGSHWAPFSVERLQIRVFCGLGTKGGFGNYKGHRDKRSAKWECYHTHDINLIWNQGFFLPSLEPKLPSMDFLWNLQEKHIHMLLRQRKPQHFTCVLCRLYCRFACWNLLKMGLWMWRTWDSDTLLIGL